MKLERQKQQLNAPALLNAKPAMYVHVVDSIYVRERRIKDRRS